MNVSVIIPVYNRAGFVKEAIDSVLSQTSANFEVIVIDDGSTDNTKQILHSYLNKIIVISQDNKGVSYARNQGVLNASYEWIAFLDSDDIWLPNKLFHQVAFIEANKDVLICQTEEIWIKNGTRVNPKKRHKKRSGMIFERSLELCLVSPSAVMIKKDFFKEIGGFDEDLPACEDYDLWLRISCRYPIYLIEKPLIIKRGGHIDQLSRTPLLDKYRIYSIKKILESGLLSPSQKLSAEKVLKEKCEIFANGCIKRGKTDEAYYYL
ncbi:MAG: glycosyltransferase [Desulfobacterales bacterium]|nr:glycosyltransferase [Desulfobacterales bacterium]